ncbi:hypothetical protein SLEP1_g39156 [Rubroshorea leprosula]|uniref:Uncharacterized protein n=1 Tax=Rubroshorea leprosula TaxID=152421 RepID=A0AAV5L016_9ROSI|nr:hypothetical protein SLEP1_g39156 [Rubroshorea leprosula]
MEYDREVFIVNLQRHYKESDAKKKGMEERKWSNDENDDINKQAGAFIMNFRNHLKIQREESVKYYQ